MGLAIGALMVAALLLLVSFAHAASPLDAARLAARSPDRDTRLAAYQELHQAGAGLVYPEDWVKDSEGCQAIARDAGATEAAWLCWETLAGASAGEFYYDSYVVIYLHDTPDLRTASARSLQPGEDVPLRTGQSPRRPLLDSDRMDLISSNEQRPAYNWEPTDPVPPVEERRCEIVSVDIAARRVGLWCTEATGPSFPPYDATQTVGRQLQPTRTWVTEIGASVFWTAAD